MYYAKALCKAKNPAFGQETSQASQAPSVIVINQLSSWQARIAKTVAIFGGILVIYETGVLVGRAHDHVKSLVKK